MYLRPVHADFDLPSLRKFIRDNPLGVLITAFQESSSASPTTCPIQCTHIPWIIDHNTAVDGPDKPGILRGHLARNNPHAKSMGEAVRNQGFSSNGFLEQEVCVLFNGPAHSYVTPKFYVKSKPETGKVVPTWNYSAVQAVGRAKILWDNRNEETGSYLQQQISDLTKHTEEDLMGHSKGSETPPWEVTDAPTPFIDILKKSIMGIEIEITSLVGKNKMSQESGLEDRQGVIDGFRSLGTDVGDAVARTVEERGQLKAEREAEAKAKKAAT